MQQEMQVLLVSSCQAAGAAANSKLLEQPTSIMLAGCRLTTPGAPGVYCEGK